MGTDNGVNRAGVSAMSAANAKRFVDNGDGWHDRCHQRDDVATQEISESPNGFFAPRRA